MSGYGIPKIIISSTDSNILAVQSGSWIVTSNIGTTNGLALDTSISSIVSKLGSLGQKTMAGSAPVVIASDQNTLSISAVSLPLPTGAATSAKQDFQTTLLAGGLPTILGTSGGLKIDGSGTALPISGTVTSNIGTTNGLALDVTITSLSNKLGTLGQKTSSGSAPVVIASDQSTLVISAASLPLPTGASTSTLQSTTNTLLNGGLPSVLGSSGGLKIDGSGTALPISGTIAVSNFPATQAISIATLPSLATGVNTIGKVDQGLGGTSAWKIDGSAITQPISAASLPLPTGAATDTSLTTFAAKFGSLGQKASIGSAPVVIASDQSTLPISVVSLPLPSGAATSALQTTGNSFLSSIDTKTATLVSGRVPVDGSGVTQPISGTVTSNIGTTNGLVLDSNLTSLRSQIPTTLGQKVSSASLAVVLPSDQIINTKFGDSSNLDSFFRLRVSNPETLFESKQLVDSQPLFWDDQQTTGSGTTSTYLTNQASTQISVANATAGTRVRQTFERYNYQSGKSMSITLTGILGTSATGITRKIGYFDINNGIFFQLSGSTLSIVVRSNVSGSPIDTVINQANWNLDKLDGTGSSAVTIDTSKAQIFVMDFQWLGVGRIRYGVIIGGTIIYCHQILNANILSTVWMSTPNLPLRYEISNSGVGAAANLIHICGSIMAEGGRENTGFVLTADRGITGLTTNNDTNTYPLLAMRLKSNYQMAQVDNLLLSVICTSNCIYRYCILLNPTITGVALSFTGITNSSIEAQINTTNTTTVSGGLQILSGYIDASSQQGNLISDIPDDLRLGANIAGVSDILVLGVQRITGTTETFFGSITWREAI